MSVSIVYETHATTVDNEQGIATGRLPGSLSAEGRRNAAELGERRRDDGIDVVFSSDLARAVDTCAVAFGDALPIVRDERLRECDYGSLNGAPVTDLLPRARFLTEPFPGGESYTDVVRRTEAFLRDLLTSYDGRRVLLVAHSANRWALQHLLGGAELAALVDASFDWQPGWEFTLTSGWRPPARGR
jgi:broad specificity phosphatase PhoE